MAETFAAKRSKLKAMLNKAGHRHADFLPMRSNREMVETMCRIHGVDVERLRVTLATGTGSPGRADIAR